MSIRKIALIFCAACFCSMSMYAQYYIGQNTVWTFGSFAGVDFTTSPPTSFVSAISMEEGPASVSDAAGGLLFYSDGKKVWNRLHTVMPSVPSTGIVPTLFTGSATQGATIVPVPGLSEKYYLFSLGFSTGGPASISYLRYTKVDMSLASGLGDVIPSEMGLPLADSLSEKMVAVYGDSCNVWLVVHKNDQPVFLVYNITPSGISAPVSYTCGTFSGDHVYQAGVLKVSPNRRLLVSQVQYVSGAGGTELFDFDPHTGTIANCRVLDTASSCYGAEFSPDNSKLYCHRKKIGSVLPAEICQYDLSIPTASAIIASRTTLTTYPDNNRRDLKLAPDNKIYVVAPFYSWLDRIPAPNVAGMACGYETGAVTLGTGSCTNGLPNIVVMPLHTDTTIVSYLEECIEAGGNMLLHAHPGTGMTYTWNDGSILPTLHVTTSGLYWVIATNGCNTITDSFHVELQEVPHIDLGNDTTIAGGTMLVLMAPSLSGGSYIWNTGATGNSITITEPGVYWVRFISEHCSTTDTIVVSATNGVPLTKAGIISFFPNPVSDQLQIKAAGLHGNIATIKIEDATGAKVSRKEVKLENGGIDVPVFAGTLVPGMYVITVSDNNGNHFCYPFIKQ